MTHKVSIAIATHKKTPFIKLCIDSCLNQTFDDYEIVVLDTSKTAYFYNLLKTGVFTSTDRIKYYHHHIEDIPRIGEAKKIAFGLCKGDIILEHDHDDYMFPQTLQRFSDAADKHKDCGFFYSDFFNIDVYAVLPENPMNFPTDFKFESRHDEAFHVLENIPVQILDNHFQAHLFGLSKFTPATVAPYHNYLPIHPRAWRRETYHYTGGYDSSIKIIDDTDLIFRTMLSTKFCRITGEGLVAVLYHDQNSTNISIKRKEMIGIMYRIYGKYHEKLQDFFDNFENWEYFPEHYIIEAIPTS
jgi:glycosyltransferase involved in cell wall biosynthesis